GGNTKWAYIFERDSSGSWIQVHKMIGGTVGISGNYAIVGTSGGYDVSGSNWMENAGSAYIFERDSSGRWINIQIIAASDRTAEDRFSKVSISGDYAIVGAHREDHDASGGGSLNSAGSAYLYERGSTGEWKEVQKIVASDRERWDHFGWSVSISGEYVVVGAKYEEEDTSGGNSLIRAGSAYVFERNSQGSWKQVQKIVPSDRNIYDEFGYNMHINGNFIIAGIPWKNADRGAAYVFNKDSMGNWKQQQKLLASDLGAPDRFGHAVFIDTNYVIIGAILDDHTISPGNIAKDVGSAYFFKYCPPTASTNDIITCGSYTSPSGKYTWDSSGGYYDTIPNAIMCDSVIQINLTVNAIDTSVIKNGNTLTANMANASYQWMDCNGNEVLMLNDTGRSFTATVNGDYAVIISKDGCIDTSACIRVLDVGIENRLTDSRFKIYPNPNSGVFVIELDKATKGEIEILNTLGQVIFSKPFNHRTKHMVELLNSNKGVHFVRVQDANYNSQRMILLQ
ncbi:MAG: T9SS type A sorting domain-containing protein, partial [Bacteroidetes bacterium]|nr:T9SS type A sorting domain-containing protein [Bacteroidota bacterium]